MKINREVMEIMKRIQHRTLPWSILSAILPLMLAALLLAGCGAKDNPSGSEAEPAVTAITTPVGELSLPDYWGDAVTVEDVSSDEQFFMRFNGKVGEAEALLFELSVGENGAGYLIGSAPDENGTPQPIWVDIRALEPGDGWTAEQTEQMNTLQSGVNDLLDQFYALDGFEKAEN